MSLYKISNDELIDFARKIYEEACGGYLDLKNTTCDRLVREFIDGRQVFEGILDPVMAETYRGYQGHPGPDGYAGPENDANTWTYTTNVTNVPESSGSINIYTSSSHSISLRDEPSVSPRVEDIVRPDENESNLRTNYEGNESERF